MPRGSPSKLRQLSRSADGRRPLTPTAECSQFRSLPQFFSVDFLRPRRVFCRQDGLHHLNCISEVLEATQEASLKSGSVSLKILLLAGELLKVSGGSINFERSKLIEGPIKSKKTS